MKNALFVLMAMAICGVLGSCSPKVTVDHLTGYYPSRSADSVMVYELGDSVPQEAVTIGQVAVKDGGMVPTYDCLYGNMLALAVKQTAQSGGNALRIDRHKTPGLESTCHRIWGTMLLLPDSLVTVDVLTTLQKIEMNQDIEIANMVRNEREKIKRMSDTPQNILKLDVGFAFMTSYYQFYNHLYKARTGYELTASYQHLWGSFGAGLQYTHAGFSFDEGVDVGVNLVGPSFVMAFMLDRERRWCLDYSLTLGYGWYTERYMNMNYSEGNFSGMLDCSIDYKLSKHLALGLQLGIATLALEKPEGLELEKNEVYGFQRFNVQAGLRYYF